MARKKTKLPKKIGGFKLPKSVRKSALLRSLLSSPLGRDLLANAITAGAGAAAAVLVRDREEFVETAAKTAKKGTRKGTHIAGLATEMVQSAANAVMEVVSETALNFTRKQLKPRRGKNGRTTAH